MGAGLSPPRLFPLPPSFSKTTLINHSLSHFPPFPPHLPLPTSLPASPRQVLKRVSSSRVRLGLLSVIVGWVLGYLAVAMIANHRYSWSPHLGNASVTPGTPRYSRGIPTLLLHFESTQKPTILLQLIFPHPPTPIPHRPSTIPHPSFPTPGEPSPTAWTMGTTQCGMDDGVGDELAGIAARSLELTFPPLPTTPGGPHRCAWVCSRHRGMGAGLSPPRLFPLPPSFSKTTLINHSLSHFPPFPPHLPLPTSLPASPRQVLKRVSSSRVRLGLLSVIVGWVLGYLAVAMIANHRYSWSPHLGNASVTPGTPRRRLRRGVGGTGGSEGGGTGPFSVGGGGWQGREGAGMLLNYKLAEFYRVIDRFICQAGVNTESIYGGNFKDDLLALLLKHNKKGLLSAANIGPDTTTTHFSIVVAPAPHLDGHYPIFGQVVSGWEVVERINKLAKPSGSGDERPRLPVVIADCGEIK
ncbi:unnamed protein product [Closterium sp. NIES-54]